MSKRIQGITIELDGDSTPLQKALKDVDKTSQATTKELGQINRALKFDEGNTTLLSQKFDVLQESISNTSTRLDALKQAQSEVDRQFKAGEIDASTYRAFQREIEITEGKLQAFKKQADDVKAKIEVQADPSAIDKMKSQLKELGPAAKEAGRDIADGIKAGAAAISTALGGVAIGTQELNTDLARLKTNASLAGRDMGLVEDAFKRVAEVSGETDSAVETVSNLLQSGFNDNQLAEAIDYVNGAAIRFSDTLKTEGIADGIQETFATGKAIGQFGELLERSGVNLDDFNEKMATMKTEGEKSNYILDTLGKLGLTEVIEKYKELNPEIAANNEANMNLQTSLAQLGLILTPLIVTITDIITKLAEWMSANPELVTTLAIVAGAITGLSGVFAVLGPLVTGITAAMPVLGGLFAALTGPLGLVVAAIVALIAIFVTFKDDIFAMWNDSIKPLFDQFASIITDNLQPAFDAGFKAISDIVKGAFDVINQLWESLLKPAFETIIQVVQKDLMPAFEKGFKTASDVVKTAFDAIKTVWNSVLHPIIKIIIDILKVTLLPAFQMVFGAVSTTVSTAFDSISKLWTGTLKPVFTGIIDFITGIFTGNWEKAWNGVVTTFSGIFEGVSTAVKTPLNAVISMINAVIGGLNSLSIDIPDWVPGFGGQKWGVNIPTIPMLAKGTEYFKGGYAIVGEEGPELVKMPTGSKVYPNDKTQKMLGGTTITQNITIISPNPTSASENARKFKQASQQLAMEWSVTS